METKKVVLEIGCEEIPASYLKPAADQLVQSVSQLLKENQLNFQKIKPFYTPRRLGLEIQGVPDFQAYSEKWVAGPPVSAAFDEKGHPTRAAEGFARAHGVSVSALTRRQGPKGEVVAVLKREGGRQALDILKEVFPKVVEGLRFPRMMRWGNGDFLFARPIRWVLAVYSKSVVPFSLAGLSSGRETRGLRAAGAPVFELESAEDYFKTLKDAGILADPIERRAVISRGLNEEAARLGGKLQEDEGLLDEVVNLVESPVVVSGTFPKHYLELPAPVLVCAMREHQKYFAVTDDRGNLLPFFLTVLNGRPAEVDPVVKGNEAVLRARLDDAAFFFREDLKTPLEVWATHLSGITWLEGLGSMADKAERLGKTAQVLARKIGLPFGSALRKAALLCKADLATQIIREKEFNSLHGVMGAIYAEKQGHSREVVRAVEEHLRPRFAGDGLPESPLGALLAVADKMDQIVGCFSAGHIPSGSQDPFALRRQALGVLQILSSRRWNVNIGDLIFIAAKAFRRKIPAGILKKIEAFFMARLPALIAEQGVAEDAVRAVLQSSKGRLSFAEEMSRAAAVQQWKKEGWFIEIATAANRVIRILPKGRKKGTLNKALLRLPEEKELCRVLQETRRKISRAGSFEQSVRELSALTPAIHAFFEKVLVMDKNAKVRNNRLVLLKSTAALFLECCDFQALVLPERAENAKP